MQDKRIARNGATVLLQGEVSSRRLHRSGTDLAGDGCILTELEVVDLAGPDIPLEDLPSIRVGAQVLIDGGRGFRGLNGG